MDDPDVVTTACALMCGLATDMPGLMVGLLAALAGAGIGAGALLLDMRRRALRADPGDGADVDDLGADAVFMFRGRALQRANPAGRALLARLGREGDPADRLRLWMSVRAVNPTEPPSAHRGPALVPAAAPVLAQQFEAFLGEGAPFMGEFPDETGRHLEVHGTLRGALACLTLRDATAARQALKSAEAELERLVAEAGATSDLVDWAPVCLWRRDRDGRLRWANQSYQALAETLDHAADPGCRSMFSQPADLAKSSLTGQPARRVSLNRDLDGQHWYDVIEAESGDEVIGIALDAGPTVRAEAALKRFIETLTETFAHLPTGLAVFDRNRRLGLFNPAISDILKLDPAWLATRPSLRDFLEKLRENRQMPDQPDFMAWRRKLTALERDAEEASYAEDWVLPSGQTLQVSGQPHPQGAIAFLFEDISSSVMLERRYRAEIETQKAVLDRLPDAVALFRADGTLAFANTAFDGVWRFSPALDGDTPHISQLIERWAALSEPSPVWSRLRDFATAEDARASWYARLLLQDGRIVRAQFAPLPDGSTLTSFCDETDRERMQAELREAVADLETERTLFLDREADARGRLEQGLSRLARISDRLDPELSTEIADLLSGMQVGVRGLSRRPSAEAEDEARPVSAQELPALLRAVQRIVNAQELSVTADLAVDGDLPGLSHRRLRQFLHNMLSEMAATPAIQIHLRIARDGDRLILSATGPLSEDKANGGTGLAGALLQRQARLEGGVLDIETDTEQSQRRLICTLPLRDLAQAARNVGRADEAAGKRV
ncbi:MAG: PAS-domain containing protein [Pseudomonadota bacterium]